MEHIIEKIKQIEKLFCENFEDLEIEDPIEEGTYDEYIDGRMTWEPIKAKWTRR